MTPPMVDEAVVLQLSEERLLLALVWEVLCQDGFLKGTNVMNPETCASRSPRDDAGLSIYICVADLFQDGMEAKGKGARRSHGSVFASSYFFWA